MSVIALHDDDDDKVVDFSTRQSKAACDPNGKAVTVRLRGYAYSRWRRVCTVASYLFIFTHDAAKKHIQTTGQNPIHCHHLLIETPHIGLQTATH